MLIIPMRLNRIGHIRQIADKGVLWAYRRSLLLVSKMSRSTLSNVNLTPCVYYTSSKRLTLRLMPSDRWRKRIEQLGLGFQLHIREPEARTLEVVVGWRRSGSGEMIDQLTRRGREKAHEWGEKRLNANAEVGEPAGTSC